MNETALYKYLKEHNIEYQRLTHPAVFTVEEANLHLTDAPGARTKNLFICDEKKRSFYLLWTPDNKRVDFKQFGKLHKIRKARFGSAEKLMEYLGVTPGAVSILTLINDKNKQVKLLVDKELWGQPSYQCHPLVNTSTLVIPQAGIEKFLELTGHEARLISVPTS